MNGIWCPEQVPICVEKAVTSQHFLIQKKDLSFVSWRNPGLKVNVASFLNNPCAERSCSFFANFLVRFGNQMMSYLSCYQPCTHMTAYMFWVLSFDSHCRDADIEFYRSLKIYDLYFDLENSVFVFHFYHGDRNLRYDDHLIVRSRIGFVHHDCNCCA